MSVLVMREITAVAIVLQFEIYTFHSQLSAILSDFPAPRK